MYVAPNTTIHILKGIPLNKSYENTVYYKDAETQKNAFLKYQKFQLTNYSYQRSQLGTIRVQLKYEDLYDCDYLMFQNTSFGSKWFYAFITGVAYISNEVSEIYYELDVMQTWCYDYSFLPSFVERRHQDDDALYGNLQPEGLELGTDYAIRQDFQKDFKIYYAILSTQWPGSAANDTDLNDKFFNNYHVDASGIYNGLDLHVTKNIGDYPSMRTALKHFIDDGLEDAIVSIFEVPCSNAAMASVDKNTFTIDTAQSYPDGYLPKNKKLYSYPYCKITVTNNRGIAKDYKPEYWTHSIDGNNLTFRYNIVNSAYPDPDARFEPVGYRAGNSPIDEGIVYGTFPTCASNGNAFKVWLAQNRNSYIASINAIGNSYDTNVAIAQNNYQMATRSANASAMMANNSTNNTLSNALMQNNTSLNNAYRKTQASELMGAASVFGNAITGNLGGAVNSAVGMINNGINWVNQQDTINASNEAAQNTAGTALLNTSIAQSTALKNASTSQASSLLSALTAKQNATAQLVAKKQDIQNLPATAKGNATGDGLIFTSVDYENAARPGFEIEYKSINIQWELHIDHYFTCYGYAQNELFSGESLDHRINRQHFTYLKTVGCAITGHLNSNDQIAIQSIYDNGIETWDTLENVGHFEISNDCLV